MPVNDPSLSARPLTNAEKTACYTALWEELAAVLKENRDPLVAMVTLNALIKKHIPYAYWVGFYRGAGSALTIGPYQGTLGCLAIPPGKGVCGASYAANRPICVADTHDFPGHIACDTASLSELVIPYYGVRAGAEDIDEGVPLGVLDVDSDQRGSFNEVDKKHLSRCLRSFLSPLLPAEDGHLSKI